MKSAALILLLLPLMACGGGGNSSQPNDPPPATVGKINPDNAADIVKDALDSFDGISGIDNLVFDNPVTLTSKTSNQTNSLLPVTYCGEDPQTDTGHGFMEISISGNFITTLNILIGFSQCELEPLIVADGDYELDFVGDGDIGPDSGNGTNTVAQTFTNLSITDDNQNLSAAFDGSLVSVNQYEAPNFSWNHLLNIDINATEGALSFENWQKDLNYNIESNQLAVNINGDFITSVHNGSFSFMMVEPIIFEAVLVNNVPEVNVVLSGKFKITADDNSSVTTTIISPTLAQLEIDYDGDGSIDVTVTVQISDLNLLENVPS